MYSRITKVEYVGKSAIRNLMATEIPGELQTVGNISFLLALTVKTVAGQVMTLFVPITQTPDDDDEKKKRKEKALLDEMPK